MLHSSLSINFQSGRKSFKPEQSEAVTQRTPETWDFLDYSFLRIASGQLTRAF